MSTVPGLGEGAGRSKARGSKNLGPTPPPKQNWGCETQFGSRETWQHGEVKTEGGEQQTGPPRSPEKGGKSLKALRQGGPKGSLSAMQPGRGDALFPGAVDIAEPMGFVNSIGRLPQSDGMRLGPW